MQVLKINPSNKIMYVFLSYLNIYNVLSVCIQNPGMRRAVGVVRGLHDSRGLVALFYRCPLPPSGCCWYSHR